MLCTFMIHSSFFIIHYSLKNLSPTDMTLSGTNFSKNPRYHPRLRDTSPVRCFPPLCIVTVCGRQILPRTRGSARSALGSPFAQAPSRVSSIGGSLYRRGCGTILRLWFMMVYHNTNFLFCQGVLGFFRGNSTQIR